MLNCALDVWFSATLNIVPPPLQPVLLQGHRTAVHLPSTAVQCCGSRPGVAVSFAVIALLVLQRGFL